VDLDGVGYFNADIDSLQCSKTFCWLECGWRL